MKRKIDVKYWVYLATLCLITALVIVVFRHAREAYDLVVWFGFFFFCIDPFSSWISRKVVKE